MERWTDKMHNNIRWYLTVRFHYMAVADNRQRYMPHPDDRLPGRGEQLAYPEAVRLVDPIEPEFKGEVLYIVFLIKSIGLHY